MSTDTKTVDVLAVLALARECLRNSSQQTPDGLALHSAVAQASAAIAELIEADKEFDAALLDEANAEQGDDDELYCNALKRLQWAEDRRRAAIRAVSGEVRNG